MMDQLSELLHLLLCKERHIYDMMKLDPRLEGMCYYYLEANIASEIPQPDQARWVDIKEKFKGSLEFSSDQEALEFVKKVLQLSMDLNELISGNHARMSFVRELLS